MAKRWSPLRRAMAIPELATSLEVIAEDDGKELTELTVEEMVEEARYVLDCFYESGHALNDDLHDDDPHIRRTAQRNAQRIAKFIKDFKE